MSRWNNKTRVPSFAFPLESLAKEKENTNRPIAARSAGTVGKWGTTSFTSIRTPSYGYASFSPKQDALTPNISPQSGDGNVTPNASSAAPPSPHVLDAPKPKKFFKSRNFLPDPPVTVAGLPAAPLPPIVPVHHAEKIPKLSLKLNKKKPTLDAAEKPLTKVKSDKGKATPDRVRPTEKTAKPEKPKSKKVHKSKEKSSGVGGDKVTTKVNKPIELPTRVLSRQRKTVNYTENRSRSPSPAFVRSPSIADEPTDAAAELNESHDISVEFADRLSPPLDVPSSKTLSPPPPPPPPPILHHCDEDRRLAAHDLPAQLAGSDESPVNTTNSNCSAVAKITNHDHPPIVLRISKGTSRLISTDSDEPVQSPPPPQQQLLPPLPPPPLPPQPCVVVTSAVQTPSTPPAAIVSTAELLAVLSDDIEVVPEPATQSYVESNHADDIAVPTVIEEEEEEVERPASVLPTTSDNLEHIDKPKGIKIKIKTSSVRIFAAAKSESVRSTRRTKSTALVTAAAAATAVIETTKKILKTRASRRCVQTKDEEQTITTTTTNIPTTAPSETVIEDFDLYRTLASHSADDEKDEGGDSQSLGSISSTFAVGVLDDSSHVICSRGSSGVTSDPETSQDSTMALVAAVSPQHFEQDNRLDNAIEPFEDHSAVEVFDDIAMECSTPPSPPQPQPVRLPTATPRRMSRRRAKSPLAPSNPPPMVVAAVVPAAKEITSGRVTRNNGSTLPPPIQTTVRPLITKSYGRKRKQAPTDIVPEEEPSKPLTPTTASTTEQLNSTTDDSTMHIDAPPSSFPHATRSPVKCWYGSEAERKKLKKSSYTDDSPTNNHTAHVTSSTTTATSSREANVNNNLDIAVPSQPPSLSSIDDDKPNVKLVISKKKGSIFKSRATETSIGETSSKPKRHVYKHKWDDDKDKSSALEAPPKSATVDTFYDEFEDADGGIGVAGSSVGGNGGGGGGNTAGVAGCLGGSLTRVIRKRASPGGGGCGSSGGGNGLVEGVDNDTEEATVTGVRCDTKAKTFYTVVRNVKMAHQIQEIGEFQEMDDDVEYILDALQSTNPMATRCLSAIQLACKCMEPSFRMHVRAHGTITRFFKALNDATSTQSLGLCTATVMFVLNQDNMSMDLDRDSLSLMLSLLESDASHRDALDNCGLTAEQLQRNTAKVREICAEIKSQGKAIHLNLDNITVGTLAMETLLSLTSKQAGDWFKEELRKLGGLEKIIDTICECCRQISDYVVDWTNALLERLRKIERCLRVLELVSTQNERNQAYILAYKQGHAVDSLVNFYKLCDREIALYPTTDATPKDNPGVVLREALVPTLKVLINLTHPFCAKALGSELLGQKRELVDTSLHLLLQATHYVPERCIFELSILVLLLLINLTIYTIDNRVIVMEANAPSDFGNQFDKVPAIKALIEYFYNCEELARLVEENTDAILDNPKKSERKGQSADDMEETVSKLLKKASHHMEHTMIASYVCLLIGHLIMDSSKHQKIVRQFLKDGSFNEMIQILEKYYNFLNLTANAEASMVAHIKQTKKIIDYFQKCDPHSDSPDHTASRSPSPLPPPKKTFNRSYANSSATAAAAASSSTASNAFFSSR